MVAEFGFQSFDDGIEVQGGMGLLVEEIGDFGNPFVLIVKFDKEASGLFFFGQAQQFERLWAEANRDRIFPIVQAC